MRTTEELLTEIEKTIDREHTGIQVKKLWADLLREFEQRLSDDPEIPNSGALGAIIESHENLLKIVICINEQAIYAWVDGLIVIHEGWCS